MENKQIKGDSSESVETEKNNKMDFSIDAEAASFWQTKNLRSNGVSRNYTTGASPSSDKRPANGPKQKSKATGRKYTSTKPIAQQFASKQARKEIANYEELKNKAASNLNAVYDEIRPAIEAHGLDNQDKVPTSIASKWMDANCEKWKADFNLSFSIINNVMFPPKADDSTETKGSGGEGENKSNF